MVDGLQGADGGRSEQGPERGLDRLADRLLRVLHAIPVGVMVADAAGRWEITNAVAARLASQDLDTLECWDVPLIDARGEDAGTVRVISDVSDRQAAEKALAESEARYRAVFDNAAVPFVLLDADGRLLQYNRAWASLLGYVPDADGVVSLASGGWDMAPVLPLGPESTANRGLPAAWEQSFVRKDGTLSWVEIRTVCPIRDEASGGVSTLAVVRDVTARHRLEETLRGAIVEAESANRAKSAFLATMSHEIRTPLNGIMGMLELALQRPLEAETGELLSTSLGASRSLLGIINDILDFSKIEAGHMQVERVPMNPADVVEDVAESLAGATVAKGLRLAVEVDPETPEVLGDPLRLRQVLANLVGNALKFTETGRISIAQDVLPTGGKEAAGLRFSVRDTGIGIAREALPRLFQPFAQAEESTTRRFGGTGLGLSISQRLVALMGGDLEAESEQGKGATFSFVLTMPRVAGAAPAVSRIADLEGLRCRVALEDGREARHMARLLTAAGMIVCEAAGPADLTIGDTPNAGIAPGVRLVDVGMMSGPGNGPGNGTAVEGRQDLPRPLRRRALFRAVAQAAGQGAETAPPVAAARWRGQGRLLVAEDNPVNAKVLRRQLAHFALACDLFENGEEALAAWRGGAYAALLTDCHMPVMDGYALARVIRAEEAASGRRLPIIALTANAVAEETERCRAVGMDAVLTKPVSLDDLAACLSRWLAPAEDTEDTGDVEDAAGYAGWGDPADGPDARPPDLDPPPLDLEVLRRQVGGDGTFLDGILSDFRDDFRDGLAVLRAAVAEGAWGSVGARAHKLKGTAGALGARRLSERCHAVEQAARAGAVPLSRLADVEAEYGTLEAWLAGRPGAPSARGVPCSARGVPCSARGVPCKDTL